MKRMRHKDGYDDRRRHKDIDTDTQTKSYRQKDIDIDTQAKS